MYVDISAGRVARSRRGWGWRDPPPSAIPPSRGGRKGSRLMRCVAECIVNFVSRTAQATDGPVVWRDKPSSRRAGARAAEHKIPISNPTSLEPAPVHPLRSDPNSKIPFFFFLIRYVLYSTFPPERNATSSSSKKGLNFPPSSPDHRDHAQGTGRVFFSFLCFSFRIVWSRGAHIHT